MRRDSWGRKADSEWRRYEVSALIKAGALEIGDGYRAKNDELATSGLPFARAGNIKDGFQFADADRFPEENLERIGNKISESDDVVFTSKGTVGRFAFVREDTPRFVYSPQLCFWRSRDHGLIDPRFLFYWMSGREFFVQFKGVAGQTDMAEYVSLRDQRSMRLTLPPLPEQHTIAHILGTLDDKIELIRRMNETLEEMARALFKSWFIDFDPVHAKAALKRHAAAQITPPLRGSRQAKGDSPQASRWGDHAAPHPPRRWAEIKRQYSPQTLQRAQALRQNQTNAEGLLWHYLSRKQLAGYRFRRQQPIGPYIADFACLSEKLLIELDGGQHAERTASDNRRDRFLQEKGYRVLRFWNHEVFENCFGVLESIYAALPHHPPLEGGSKDGSLSGRGSPPPPQPAPDGLASATPPPGGSDWSVERARSYLDGMDPSIAAMFPDRFVDSELGEIPEGWEVKALDAIAAFQNGLALQKFRPQENEEWLPVVKIAQLRSGKADSGEKSTANIRSECIIDDGDIIFSWSGSLTVKVWCGGRAALNQHLFKVTSMNFPKWFFMHCVCSHLGDFQTIAAGKATTMGHIKRHHLSEAMCVVPNGELLAESDGLFSALLEKSISANIQSRSLIALRDTLLPKLMSGEIRLHESAKTLDAVT